MDEFKLITLASYELDRGRHQISCDMIKLEKKHINGKHITKSISNELEIEALHLFKFAKELMG